MHTVKTGTVCRTDGRELHRMEQLALLIRETVTFTNVGTRKEVEVDNTEQMGELAFVPSVRHTVLVFTVWLAQSCSV